MKRIKEIIFTIFIVFISVIRVNALSVNKNEITMERGSNNSIELYANTDTEVTNIDFTLVYSTYDIDVEFISSDGNYDSNPYGVAHKLTLQNSQKGKILLGSITIVVKEYSTVNSATITLNNATATTTNGNNINLNNQIINVTVGTPEPDTVTVDDTQEDNLLEKIESNIVDINLKENVFEYTVTVSNEITELDLVPITKYDNTSYEISSQKIDEIKANNNQIIIDVTNNVISQKYIINVNIKDAQDIEEDTVVIDNNQFINSSDYKYNWIVIIGASFIALFIGICLNKKR